MDPATQLEPVRCELNVDPDLASWLKISVLAQKLLTADPDPSNKTQEFRIRILP